ncbi:phosphoribosylglycinamide formyltransferase [Paucilactobacillus oligofermentans DSM 15707 = LMG 22743]|uniref:Phosphoribosylglycinamide formyltransferase n=1 Tax=Paucilactobacillus oligofermentans DSM 15707 = LMG 22743 TaxID=1423778 RepID=A0A0R1RQ72_9LACO|nr:phosphoribosylglycinamide formyltransferase [Paucilactobacillus oligofermentans]KRL55400.1 phosphoribosylglycinamide formyltransferase [Paucilactobacillus oligofermentans DSM 15707 = LMG 22743]CUS25610.1 Phosphoribosylglycinamide formyltransferase PurN [Paucilactobacillus oligofermentans DSM 15707 = LMG 22743]
MINVAIFASGTGTNFSALIAKINASDLPIKVISLICDHPEAQVVQRAHEAKIPVWTHTLKEFNDKHDYETAIETYLAQFKVDLLILAGYMKIVSPVLLSAFSGQIINIHPAMLPKFPGRHGIEDAFAAGVTSTGVTVHYVDTGVDTGPIIAQQVVEVLPTDDIDSLATRIHRVEHQLYFDSLCKVIEQKHLS